MLGKKEKKDLNVSVSSGALNLLGEGTVIEGDLSSSGDLRIDGQINGNLNTQGKCVLGATGKISGNIKANCCDISGTVDGDLQIGDLLLIKSKGKVNGDIKTSKIVIESGGELNGSCIMGGAAPKGSSNQNNVKAAKS